MRRTPGPRAFLKSAVRSLLSATATVGGLVVVEGLVLMKLGYDWGYQLVSEPYCAVHAIDFAVCDDGQRSVCLVRAVPRDPYELYEHRIVVHDLPSGTPLAQVPAPRPETRAVVAIPHSSRALVGCGNGDLYMLDTRVPKAMPHFFGRHEPGSVSALICAADGRHVLSLGGNGICAWEIDGGQRIWQRTDVPFASAAFHPDALRIAAALTDGTILQLDLHSGQTTRSLAALETLPFELQISPDGRGLLVVCELSLVLLDWETGAERWSRPHRSSRIAFAPRGDWIASSGYRHDRGPVVLLFDPRTGDPLASMAGHQRQIIGVKFSRDGSVYSWGLDGTIRHWRPEESAQIRSLDALGLEPA